MFDVTRLATNREGEVNGTWTEDLGNGLRLQVAREGNVKYNAALREEVRKRTGAANLGDLQPDVAVDVAYELYSRFILVGWEGLVENGKTLVYSPEEAKRLFQQYPDFFNLVQAQARNVALFRIKKTSEALGNSVSDSSGS